VRRCAGNLARKALRTPPMTRDLRSGWHEDGVAFPETIVLGGRLAQGGCRYGETATSAAFSALPTGARGGDRAAAQGKDCPTTIWRCRAASSWWASSRAAGRDRSARQSCGVAIGERLREAGTRRSPASGQRLWRRGCADRLSRGDWRGDGRSSSSRHCPDATEEAATMLGRRTHCGSDDGRRADPAARARASAGSPAGILVQERGRLPRRARCASGGDAAGARARPSSPAAVRRQGWQARQSKALVFAATGQTVGMAPAR